MRGSKINFYKFVDPDGGKSSGSGVAAKGQEKLVKTIKLQTTAINGLGATVNSLGTVVKDIKKQQISLLEVEKKRAKAKFKPIFLKPQKLKKFSGFDSLFKGKIPGFFESLLNLIGSFAKLFLVLPALKWLADPDNQDTVVSILKTMHKVFKFIAGWAKFSINNTIEGLYDLLADESTLRERIGGLFQALKGLGAAWLGISLLTNPMAVVNTFKNVLIFFNRGLMTAAAKLAAHPLVAIAGGVALFTAGKYIPKVFPGSVDSNEREISEGLENSGDGMADSLTREQRIAELKKEKENLNFIDRLFSKGQEIDELIYYLETGQTKGYGFFGKAFGGYLDGYAKGGWISGPQSGYPVSLDGNKPDFIGHGTEYVARRSDGGAFVVPFDTMATRAMPGLTEARLAEAAQQGFLFGGGGLDKFTRAMIKEHEGLRLNKYQDSLGYTSIGYGHLVKPDEKIPNTISRAFAEQLFNKDYKHHKQAAQGIPGYKNLSLQQKAAMIDLTFNMGPEWHKEFPLMMAALQKKDYNTAAAELKNSLYYNQVGRRGVTTVSLMNNNGVGDYLKVLGIVPPAGSDQNKQNFGFAPIFNMLLGAQPAGASELDLFNQKVVENKGRVVASNLGNLTVIPASHKDTATGWGIKGVTDSMGRPVVLSQPAAAQFMQMISDSKGQVTGADVASSGRSIKHNAKVGGHENSVHLYGEGLDVSGSTYKWMLKNGIKYGWKYKYSQGPGSGHFDYVGVGSGKTPILSPFKTGKSFMFTKDTKHITEGLGRPSVGIVGANSNMLDIFKEANFSEKLTEMFGGDTSNTSLMDLFSGGFTQGGMSNNKGLFSGKPKFSKGQGSYEEQARVRRVTEQRNQARREINAKTTEIVQMALAAVESSNGSNREFIQVAEAGIRQLLGAQAGGGTFANVQGTTGTVLRTAVAVLNSFNNPLRGIFT